MPAHARPLALTDPQGRVLDYLRLSVTDRCNLRCRYCMPAEGVTLVPHAEVLRFEELERLARIFVGLGVRKIRVTGGEPLVRRGVVDFLATLAALSGGPEILLTTNGALLADRLDAVKAAGVRRINLSLDALDPETYRAVTRRDDLAAVLPLLDAIPAAGLELKVNAVVVPGVNDHALGPLVDLARTLALTVRFIEPMPFAGGDGRTDAAIDGDAVLAILRDTAPLERLDVDDGVAELYGVPGWRGRIGLIRGHARSFCGDCSRLRLDARGGLRTCLYGREIVNLRDLLRNGADDDALTDAIRAAVAGRLADGRAAERDRDAEGPEHPSMAGLGG